MKKTECFIGSERLKVDGEQGKSELTEEYETLNRRSGLEKKKKNELSSQKEEKERKKEKGEDQKTS